MDDVTESLAYRFHNLGGATIAEHKRSYRAFKKHLHNVPPKEVAALLDAIEPNNNQENLFHLDLLQEFQQYDRLLGILCGNNRILKKILLNDHLFLQFIVDNVKVEKLVVVYFPKMSMVDRIRFVNKLGKILTDVRVGEHYFRTISERYGAKMASPLLLSCNEDFIKEYIIAYGITFNDSQLIRLFVKFPKFLVFYFENCDANFAHYPKLAQFLVDRHINDFNELLKYGEPRIGKRAFVRYFNLYRREVLESKLFSRHFRLIHKNVSKEEYLIYLKKWFPEKWEGFYGSDELVAKLRPLPINERGEVFYSIYKKLYRKEFEGVDYSLLNVFSNKDRLKMSLEETKRIKYLEPRESIPMIKEKLDKSKANYEDSQWLDVLIEACSFDKSGKSLLNVLEYIDKNHEERLGKYVFWNVKQYFSLHTLNADCWVLLDKFGYDPDKQDYLVHKILKKCLSNETIVDELYIFENVNYLYYNKPHVVLYKKVILQALKTIPEMAMGIEQRKNCIINWMNALREFNEWNRKKLYISYFDFPDFLQVCLDNIETNDYAVSVLESAFCIDPMDKKIANEMLQAFVDKKEHCHFDLIYRIFKFYPELLRNKQKWLILGTNRRFAYEISKSHFNGLAAMCYSEAISAVDSDRVSEALKILSFHSNYLDIVEKLKPEKLVINTKEDGAKCKLLKQKYLLRNFKNLNFSERAIDFLMYYSNKDYLQYTVRPLYSLLYNTPEERIETYLLKTLYKRAVSVRKHAVYLTPQLLTISASKTALKLFTENEKNASIQKHLARCTFNYFCRTTHAQILELLLKQINTFMLSDEESTKMLITYKKIPKPLLASYVETVWKLLTKNSEFLLLKSLSKETIQKLPSDFCDEIVSHVLFNENNKKLEDTYEFIYNYLLANPHDIHRVQLINKLIKAYTSNTKEIFEIMERIENVYRLFEFICQQIIKNPTEETVVICNNLLINKTEIFEIDSHIHLTKHYLNAAGILGYLNEAIENYSKHITVIYAKVLKRFLKSISFDSMEVLENLIDASQDNAALQLIMELLPEDKIAFSESNLLPKLQNVESNFVKAHLDDYFTKGYVVDYKLICTQQAVTEENERISRCRIGLFG